MRSPRRLPDSPPSTRNSITWSISGPASRCRPIASGGRPHERAVRRKCDIRAREPTKRRMKTTSNIGLKDVQAVYGGPEGDLWELVMGQQIHIGGFHSSMDLAERAGIGTGMHGVDLCCCNGAGMRFLVKFRGVASMRGVDATSKVVERGRRRCQALGLADRITFTLADVCDTGLPSGSADFVWGEDAWCYVADKPRLIAEAARLVKPGGVIAFTDWVEGSKGLSAPEAERLLMFMKFPSLQDLKGYPERLKANGCNVKVAEDTGRFAP